MYTLLVGARINAGDYLIGHRGIALIEKYTPSKRWIAMDRWRTLDDRLDEINRSRAVILLGGPAYKSDFYPNVYPLSSKGLEAIRVPITAMGLGWSGVPMHAPEQFLFTPESKQLLDRIHQNSFSSSCRDVMTRSILDHHGYKNVEMTGCPAWYSLEHLDLPFQTSTTVNSVAVSIGVKPKLLPQTFKLLRRIKALFPRATLYATFHHGLKKTERLPTRLWIQTLLTRAFSESLGYRSLDLSGSVESMKIYDECSLHVGYRVHAHINRLSQKKPSYLLCEDGRGLGLMRSLATPDVDAYASDSLDTLIASIDRNQRTSNRDFEGPHETMLASFSKMKKFLSDLP